MGLLDFRCISLCVAPCWHQQLEFTSTFFGMWVGLSPLLDSLAVWFGCWPLLFTKRYLFFILLFYFHGVLVYLNCVWYFYYSLLNFWVWWLVLILILFDVSQQKKVSLLMGAAVLEGASIGPLVQLAIDFDPRYII